MQVLDVQWEQCDVRGEGVDMERRRMSSVFERGCNEDHIDDMYKQKNKCHHSLPIAIANILPLSGCMFGRSCTHENWGDWS